MKTVGHLLTRMHTGVIPITGKMAINENSHKADWEQANFESIVATLVKEVPGFKTIHDMPDDSRKDDTLKQVNRQVCKWFK